MSRRLQIWLETLAVLAIFFIEGAYPVPEVNEPYYLGKAIHYWNPQWCQRDFFLNTPDAHQVFYFAVGWISLVASPLVFAWITRILTWALLAWSWRRLSAAIVPRPWFSVLSAALLVALIDRCHMAGEWLIGGVEAKGFAYVLVFLALEAMVRNRWRSVWLLLGAAAAFHVLVGGWAVVAAMFAWTLGALEKQGYARRGLHDYHWRRELLAMLPALAAGGLFACVGLLPVLAINRGVAADVIRQASEIYVFDRLYHHLDPWSFPTWFVARFVGLGAIWLLLCWLVPSTSRSRPLRRFVAATMLIATCGAAISLLTLVDPVMAAGLLRVYWFRLADIMVPLGVAIELAGVVAAFWRLSPPTGHRMLVVVSVVAGLHLAGMAVIRPVPQPPPADKFVRYQTWRDVCNWIAASPKIPPNARFLTPRQSQTFKWYTGHPEVVNWKEIPQDAAGIVEWQRRLKDIYGMIDSSGQPNFYDHPHELSKNKLIKLGRKYEFDYIVTGRAKLLKLKRLYQNQDYIVYELPKEVKP